MKIKPFLYLTIILLIGLPLLGMMIDNGSIPEHFFNFPHLKPEAKPGFNIWIFLAYSLVIIGIILFYAFPKLFGFKKSTIQKKNNTKEKFPWWFWAGWGIILPSFVLLWGHFSQPAFWVRNGYIFVFFSLILILDGIVYIRNSKKSMLGLYPGITLLLAFASSISWLFFEYLNFFVGENWYYPLAGSMSKLGFNIYAVIGAATLAPTIFEVYTLLNTFPKFKARYSNGIKLPVKKNYLKYILVLSFILLFFIPFLPNILYSYLWVGSPLIIGLVLSLKNVDHLFEKIKFGNWSPVLLMALSGFIMGFLWEGNNYLSAYHHPFESYIPGYWIYNIAYVNVIHVFEMPLLGLFGYLPYGINNWIWWNAFSRLVNNNKMLDFEF